MKTPQKCQNIAIQCYNTDFNIYTEERHVKHNKILVAMVHGYHGNSFILYFSFINSWFKSMKTGIFGHLHVNNL